MQPVNKGVIRAINRTRGTVLCSHLEDAGGSLGHGRGLLGRSALEPGQGMIFRRGRLQPFMWMHMFFMRFPIDVIFLDREDIVVAIDHQLKPWTVSTIVPRAHKAIETAAGAASRSATQLGDLIAFEERG